MNSSKFIQNTIVLISLAGGAQMACKKEGSIAPEPKASSEPAAQNSAGSAERAPTLASAEAPALPLSANTPSAVTEAPPLKLYPVVRAPAEFIQPSNFLPGKERALLMPYETAYEIQEDLIVNAHHIFEGLKPFRKEGSIAGRVEGFGGYWPDAAYAEVQWFSERGTGEGRVYEWTGTSFDLGKYMVLGTNNRLMAAAPLSKGLLVAAVLDAFAPRKSIRIQSSRNMNDYDLAKAPEDAPCDTQLGPVEDMAATPQDEAFVRGLDCKTEKPIIESFEASGKSKGITFIPDVFESQPAHKGEAPPWISMYAAAADALYLAGTAKADDPSSPRKPVLMRWNGKAWSKEALPEAEGGADSISGNSSGMMLITIGGKLWQKQKNKTWTPIALADGEKAMRTWATDGFIYAMAQADKNGTLYRSRPTKHTIVMGDTSPERPFVPATAECKTLFVVMYRATDNVGPDYDFPLTRKALQGHTEFEGIQLVVTPHNYFGAIVPTFEMGQALLKLVQEKVKGSKPQLSCAEPAVARDIPVQLKPEAPPPPPSKP